MVQKSDRKFAVVLSSFILLSALAIAISACMSYSIARADDLDASSTPIVMNVTKNGEQSGTAYLEKGAYNVGETPVLKWKGAVSGNNFIIPESVVYNGKTVAASSLIDAASLQNGNGDYASKMNQASTLADFSSLKSYLTTEHTLPLDAAGTYTNIVVTFSKVAPVYRLYNSITSEHLFSTNKTEYDNWVAKCRANKDFWIGEGIAWLAPTTTTGTQLVHRLYNKGLGALARSSHYYSSDTNEISDLVKKHGWKDEGASYQFRSGGSTPIYTCYNEALRSAHHYTSSKTEWQGLKAHGWDLEEKKNSTTGVFQCILATSWSFGSNYYTVEHLQESTDGKSYTTFEKEVKAGKANAKTAAVAKTYAGFTSQGVTQQKISKTNSTVVQIKYKRNSYKITFDGNGKTMGNAPAAQTLKYGAKISAPGTPYTDGATFGGWYWDAACTSAVDWSKATTPNYNTTIYAKWVANAFYIESSVDGGTITESCNVNYGESKTFEYAPTSGFNLQGIYVDGEEVDITKYPTSYTFTNVTATHTIYVIFAVDNCIVSFNTDGGSEVRYQNVKYGDYAYEPESPDKDDYTFIGWYLDGEKFNFTETQIKKNITLLAKWKEGNPPVENTNNVGIKLPDSIERDKVATITFVNNKNIPTTAVAQWKAGEGNSKYVMGWATVNASDSSLYDVYYGSDGHYPYLPVNCTSLFGTKSISSTSKVAFSSLTKINNLEQLDTSAVTNMASMFNGCAKLTSLNLSKFNTSSVTDMSSMFYGCSVLPSLDVSKFNTSNVTNMSFMFGACRKLSSLSLSNFNTSNVTNMGYMFRYCSALTSLSLTSFDTSSVGDMVEMFYSCTSLQTLDLSSFDTTGTEIGHVCNLYHMFLSTNSLSTIKVGDKFTFLNDNGDTQDYQLEGSWLSANTGTVYKNGLLKDKFADTYTKQA